MSHYLRVQAIDDQIQHVLRTAGEAEKEDCVYLCVQIMNAAPSRTFLRVMQRVDEKLAEEEAMLS